MDISDTIQVPIWDLPFLRYETAKHYGVHDKIAVITYGGLGDVLCCEPTIRFIVEVLKPAMRLKSVTVFTLFGGLFKHLDVEIINPGAEGVVRMDGGEEQYYYLYCGHPDSNFQHKFFTHNSMLPTDYPALSALGRQLPLIYRYLKTSTEEFRHNIYGETVVIHPGNHWDSKRFPLHWWNKIIELFLFNGITPIIVGGKPGSDTGTVEVDAKGCLDLREALSFAQSAYLLANEKVLITNDSFPLHLATIGKASIGFLATAKDPEWLMHWRRTPNKIKLGWRMEDLALGGTYQRNFIPHHGMKSLEHASQGEVIKWLPEPSDIVGWTKYRLLNPQD